MTDIQDNDPENVSFSLLLDRKTRDALGDLVGTLPGLPPDTPPTAAAVIRFIICAWKENWRELENARRLLGEHGQTIETENLLQSLKQRDIAKHFEHKQLHVPPGAAQGQGQGAGHG